MWLERKIRVLYALANCCIQQKDYELASKVLDQVHDLEETRDNQAKVRSIQGRMFLQLGMDFFIYGRNYCQIFLVIYPHEARTWDPNYIPGVDFLDHDFL